MKASIIVEALFFHLPFYVLCYTIVETFIKKQKSKIMKKMTKEEIREFNSKVDYNESLTSWVIDIISCIIAFPMIVFVVYRRGKYNHKISEVESKE